MERCLIMWINIMLNEGFTLDSSTVKCLTLVSRYFANTLKNYIERNYWFDLSYEERRLTHYSPLNQKNVFTVSEIQLSTKKIAFHNWFIKPVDKLLHNGITHIEFGEYFDRSIDFLPESLTHLTLGSRFNSSVDRLPQSLTHLIFGVNFKQTANNLPANLTHIEFGDRFVEYIVSLPPKVKQVIFGPYYNESVSHLDPTIDFQQKVENQEITIPYQPQQ
eukprot:TRINITY_DN634_c0_g1_i5.p1 TRINITY_DN634_c0_g1~~TRINITY_DN634_c0_g1_i5.p1  ORF type:complete len:219 (-),score=46.67 TRINITY_DN634_c0_g1_i5:209-865(-)